MTKSWCPEEDFYNNDTTMRKVSMTYTDLNFTVAAIITHGKEHFTNLENNKTFPALQSNKFNVATHIANSLGR